MNSIAGTGEGASPDSSGAVKRIIVISLINIIIFNTFEL